MAHLIYHVSEMEKFASNFATDLTAGAVVCLTGDLGAGKTVFTRGLARGLGYTDTVTSPTFALMHIYEGGRLPIYHFDLYRLQDGADVESIGCDEYMYAGGIAVFEWPERAKALMPADAIWINIKTNVDKGQNYREVYINEDISH